jgi:hypothetical protein
VTALLAGELDWDRDTQAAELQRYRDWLDALPPLTDEKRGESSPALPA